jgi:hypothetical protein
VALHPIVRYMVLCDNWGVDSEKPRSVNVYGLLTNIRSQQMPPYPLENQSFCVLLALTEARGDGKSQIVCVFEETGERVFQTSVRHDRFGHDPLKVHFLPFRINHCRFSSLGMYLVQFWYNDVMIDERPLRLR